MDTCDEKEKHAEREKGKVGGRGQKHLDRLCWRVEADSGERGRTDKQTMF